MEGKRIKWEDTQVAVLAAVAPARIPIVIAATTATAARVIATIAATTATEVGVATVGDTAAIAAAVRTAGVVTADRTPDAMTAPLPAVARREEKRKRVRSWRKPLRRLPACKRFLRFLRFLRGMRASSFWI